MEKVIAFIPVRCGSKSIPFKNIKQFCGKPLVYWTALAANNVKEIDEVIIATDCDEIIEVIKILNLEKVKVYRRNNINAQDTSSTEDVMLEYISSNDLLVNTVFCLIQATSPLLESKFISLGFNKYRKKGIESVLSCVRTKRFFWNNNSTPLNYSYTNRPRRQDFEGLLMENGAFYINSVDNILKEKNRLCGTIGIVEMPEYTAIEIDEEDDWAIAESLMRRHVLKPSNKDIKLFLSDVDGVLTDAGMYYSENGMESKKFNTHDGMAFQLLREAGIKTGIITSENTAIVKNRAKKLKVDYLYQGKAFGSKLEAALDICKKENISLNEIAYIGDDINCLSLLKEAGLAACPKNATHKIKSIPNIALLTKNGGDGVVREFAELILKSEVSYNN
jgi:YrbI family 3-deoxy-D-manno-octulosonate 8-phosphate phosphatase